MELDEPTLRGLEARIALARAQIDVHTPVVSVGVDVLAALVAAARKSK